MVVWSPEAPLWVEESVSFESVDDLREWVAAQAQALYGDLFGTVYPGSEVAGAEFSVDFQESDVDSFALLASSSDASTTNVQVAGVDEADLIETDGEFLYMLSHDELFIVDARDPEDLSIAARVQLDSPTRDMYLWEDRLTLIADSGGQVSVTVIDLADRSAPTQVEKTTIDGRLVESRMVDGQLRLVTTAEALEAFSYPIPAEVTGEDAAESTLEYESLESYVDRVIAAWIPSVRTFSASGQVLSDQLLDPTTIAIPGTPSVRTTQVFDQWTTVSTFDVTDGVAGPVDAVVVGSTSATQVYGSADATYVMASVGGSTDIWKFGLNEEGGIHLEATGQVQGMMQDQFAADEHDGYLRVVTSIAWGWVGHQLAVLEQQGDQLVQVGAVENLAPGEDLYSVRFFGDEAYVVTFRKVDPLFAIDLSDPTNPTVEGELKIPGYSDYLQPIGEDYLLGIGRGADEQRGRFEEMQVSLFDVSDLADPTLAFRHSIGGDRSTASAATGNRWIEGDNDHHAVGYYEEQGVLALPIQRELDTWGQLLNSIGTDGEMLFDPGEGGLLLLQIDVMAGISEIGIIEHQTPIERSLRIGDTLFAVSSGQISTHDFNDLTGEVDRLTLPTDDSGFVTLVDTLAPRETFSPPVRNPFIEPAAIAGPTFVPPEEESPADPEVEAMPIEEAESAAERPEQVGLLAELFATPTTDQADRGAAPSTLTLAVESAVTDSALLLLYESPDSEELDTGFDEESPTEVGEEEAFSELGAGIEPEFVARF